MSNSSNDKKFDAIEKIADDLGLELGSILLTPSRQIIVNVQDKNGNAQKVTTSSWFMPLRRIRSALMVHAAATP